MDKHKLEILVNKNLSIRQIAKEVLLSETTVRYWLKKFNLTTCGYIKIYNWEKDRLIDAVKSSGCKSDILRNLGISTKSGNFQTLEKYLKKYEIDINHIVYDNKRGNKWNRTYTNEEIFIKNSPYTNGTSLKTRVLKDDLIDYKCGECPNTGEWNGKKLILHLDHINGDHYDNRIDNLRFLCPNCHSQTLTYCVGQKIKKDKKISFCKCGIKKDNYSERCTTCNGYEQRKVVRPSVEVLLLEVKDLGYTGVGRKYGVSDNSIRRWLK